MAKFRKKPVEVEAMQFTDEPANVLALREEFGATIRFEGTDGDAFLWVNKGSTWARLQPGTWVIKERDNDGFYPCVDSEFQQTYGPDEGDLLYEAWGVIANVSHGDWGQQNAEWSEAATRWRDRWHATLPVGVQTEPEPA